MSLLSQLKDLRHKYLSTNAEYLRTPIYIGGGIPDAQDPGKATRRQLIPHFTILHGLPTPPPYEPDAGAEMPEQTPEDELEDVIA
jgi:hypothetical protein